VQITPRGAGSPHSDPLPAPTLVSHCERPVAHFTFHYLKKTTKHSKENRLFEEVGKSIRVRMAGFKPDI
jgi:hypothetical protein